MPSPAKNSQKGIDLLCLFGSANQDPAINSRRVALPAHGRRGSKQRRRSPERWQQSMALWRLGGLEEFTENFIPNHST
jgi:hypothetical protein